MVASRLLFYGSIIVSTSVKIMAATPRFNRPANATRTPPQAGTTVAEVLNTTLSKSTGPEIINCEGDSLAQIEAITTRMASFVEEAINDVGAGVSSDHGFYAMFKSDSNIDKVQEILTSVSNYENAPIPDPYHDRNIIPPTFVCVTANLRTRYPEFDVDFHSDCEDNPFHMPVQEQPYIYICPAFFACPRDQTRTDCPRVLNNFWGPSIRSWMGDQRGLMLQQLVTVYLGRDALNEWDEPAKAEDDTGLLELGASHAVRNPSSYQVYVSMVQQSCTDFPDPEMPPWNVVGASVSGTRDAARNTSRPIGTVR